MVAFAFSLDFNELCCPQQIVEQYSFNFPDLVNSCTNLLHSGCKHLTSLGITFIIELLFKRVILAFSLDNKELCLAQQAVEQCRFSTPFLVYSVTSLLQLGCSHFAILPSRP